MSSSDEDCSVYESKRTGGKSRNLHANQLKLHLKININNIVMRKIPKQKAVPVANLIKVEINEILKFAGTL